MLGSNNIWRAWKNFAFTGCATCSRGQRATCASQLAMISEARLWYWLPVDVEPDPGLFDAGGLVATSVLLSLLMTKSPSCGVRLLHAAQQHTTGIRAAWRFKPYEGLSSLQCCRVPDRSVRLHRRNGLRLGNHTRSSRGLRHALFPFRDLKIGRPGELGTRILSD
jgi:hypothetical protein